MLALAIIVAISVVILTSLLYWYLSLLKYAGLRNVPGPTPFPIIGNANRIGTTTVELLQSLVKLQKEFGSFYKLWVGPKLRLMITKPEYLEELLTSNVHLSKSDGYELIKPWIGDGLLTSTGGKWKSRRKMITPTFHFKILQDFMLVFNKQFDILLDLVTEEVQNNEDKPIDIYKSITTASLDIICETAFGTSIRAQFKANANFVKAVSGFLEVFILRFFSAWLKNPILFRMSSLYTNYNKYLKTLHDLSNKVIKERKAQWTGKNENSQGASEDGIKRKSALLDMLLDARSKGAQLSDEDIRAEVDTFMFEGHDTTSSGISYSLYALAQNEDVQQKVYNEIIQVIGTDSKSEITIAQINELKYLDIVVKECQRYYPSVPIVERKLREDWTVDGITIPSDTTISIFIYGMNHSADVFPEPEKFDPERFLPEKQSSRHCYSYIPFSAGPRNCIGQKFAVLEMKTCIIKYLQRFKLTPDPDFEPETGLWSVLRSRNGIQMKLSFRNKN